MRRDRRWVLMAIAPLVIALRQDNPLTPESTFIQQLKDAEDAYRSRLLVAADGLLTALQMEVDALDAKGEKMNAMRIAARKNLVDGCRAKLAAAPTVELGRLVSLLQITMNSNIPVDFLKEGLLAYFGFREGAGSKTIEDCHGIVEEVNAPEWEKRDSTASLEFSRANSILPVEIRLSTDWSVVSRIQFPIDMQGRDWANLLWGGYGADHVIVFKTGEVGAWIDGFHGSGLNFIKLQGWHVLAVVAVAGKTTFYIDGEKRGEIPCEVVEPIHAIGNAGSYQNRAQNFAARIDGLAIFDRALTLDEIRSLKSVVFP
jgi:concanavalin A-like lectin/glucanase superfamily protein